MLAAIAARGQTRQFLAGDVLISEGEPSRSIYLLLSGRAKVYAVGNNRREVIYNTVGPGEFFGEMSLDGGCRSASVAALEPCVCVVVEGDQLRDFLAEHPDFAFSMVLTLIGRVRHATDQIKSLVLEDVYQRTARHLREQFVKEGSRLITPIAVTQKDIAARVGASREMVNRILRQLIHGGYLAKDKRRLVLLKPLPEHW